MPACEAPATPSCLAPFTPANLPPCVPAAAAPFAGTRITASNECPRRSFLDERIADDGHNAAAVKGTLQHNLIQVGGRGGTLRARRPCRCARWPPCGPAWCSSLRLRCRQPLPLLPLRHAQAALAQGLRSDAQLVGAAEQLVGEATEALYQVDLSEEAALQCLTQALPGIKA